MIIIKNNVIPFPGYKCINLFSILFTRKELNDVELNHENIHTVQIIEMAIVGLFIIGLVCLSTGISKWWMLTSVATFYVWYCLEYILIRVFHKKQGDAYHDVSLEEEAHNNDSNLHYLDNRTNFSWIKYIKPKSYGKS